MRPYKSYAARLKKAVEALRQSGEFRNRLLLSHLQHPIRKPLTHISGCNYLHQGHLFFYQKQPKRTPMFPNVILSESPLPLPALRRISQLLSLSKSIARLPTEVQSTFLYLLRNHLEQAGLDRMSFGGVMSGTSQRMGLRRRVPGLAKRLISSRLTTSWAGHTWRTSALQTRDQAQTPVATEHIDGTRQALG